MPPKKVFRREDDGGNDGGNDGVVRVVNNPRIDAITADEVHPTKSVQWVSPDGSCVLYYNTRTLLKIARDKGRLLHPPHFRDPMSPEMRKLVLEKEGEAAVRAVLPNFTLDGSGDAVDMMQAAASAAARGVDTSNDEIRHHDRVHEVLARMHVDKRQLYVCPACYEHVANTRFIPSARANVDGIRIGGFRGAVGSSGSSELDETLLIDSCLPLDVLDELSAEELPFVVFRTAPEWRQHVKSNHNGFVEPSTVGENKLRDYINRFLAALNRTKFQNHKYHRMYNTTQAFWSRDTKWNTHRYNDIYQRVEAADEDPRGYAFPGVELQTSYYYAGDAEGAAAKAGDDDGDFICDDDEDDEDDEADDGKKSKTKSRTKGKKGAKKPTVKCDICGAGEHTTAKCTNITIDPLTLEPRYCGDDEARRRRRFLRNRGPDEPYDFPAASIDAPDAAAKGKKSKTAVVAEFFNELRKETASHRLTEEDRDVQHFIAQHELRSAAADSGVRRGDLGVQQDIRTLLKRSAAAPGKRTKKDSDDEDSDSDSDGSSGSSSGRSESSSSSAATSDDDTDVAASDSGDSIWTYVAEESQQDDDAVPPRSVQAAPPARPPPPPQQGLRVKAPPPQPSAAAVALSQQAPRKMLLDEEE